MENKDDRQVLNRRQERVTKLVWGLALVAAGTLMTLENLGKIELVKMSVLTASQAVDGRPDTRWSSSHRDPQWITVDLGAPAEIRRVHLKWERAYARDYKIEVSNDGATWSAVKEITNGDGDVDEAEVHATGRYVRVNGAARGTHYGYSLWELEVYGAPSPAAGAAASAQLLSQGKPVRASSTETASSAEKMARLWWLYWPLTFVLSGLPLILAPKNPTEPLLGLLISGTGAVVQLIQLSLVRWSFSQLWPILLVAGGLILVIESIRHARKASTDTEGGR